MGIRQAKAGQWREAAAMALRLWPSHEQKELEREFQQLLQNPDAAVFLLYDQNVPAGFAHGGIMWKALPVRRWDIWRGYS